MANRVVCYCGHCERYARRFARAEEILDDRGGTDIFNVSPARLEFTSGLHHLACLKLTPKGPLRWYASCCGTPVANTFPTPGAFIALNHILVDWDAIGSIDKHVGPVRAGVNGQFSGDDVGRLKAGKGALLAMILRYGWMLLGWKVRGDHKRSPFFDAKTGRPVLEATLIPKGG